MQKNNNRQRVRKQQWDKVLMICAGILISILLLAYLGISWFYKDHFYSKTFINGVDCSNLTVEQAKEKIAHEVDTYVLSISERNDITEEIVGSQIGLELIFNLNFEELLESQSPFAWIVNSWSDKNLENPCELQYDEKALKNVYDALFAFDERYITPPEDAYIAEFDLEKGFVIVPEVLGNEVDKEALYPHVKEAIKNLSHNISIEELECYKKPKVLSSDDRLINAVELANRYISTKITYQFDDTTEVFDKTIIGPAITINDQYEVSLNEEKIKDFVDYIGRTYNSFGKTRTFMTSYGVEATVKGGDYGWWLDRVTERKELMDSILLGEQKEREPVYFQKAVSYGENDFGNTYVEINLSAQHLFFYKDGELVIESDFVSGNVSKNYGTPVGTYSITYKERGATLKGEDYATPVDYWMPFNNHIGMHDADWRSRFGGNIFLTNGSHGCINLPPAVAKKIYSMIEKGDAVIVYELDGTESYKKTEMDNALKSAEAIAKRQEAKNKTE